MANQNKPLFNANSISNVSAAFFVEGQLTIAATGLQGDDEIVFEVLLVAGNDWSAVCGCDISQIQPGIIIGTQPLMCPTCESVTQQRVRLTVRNPIVVLDTPQRAVVRAVYNGSALGDFQAWVIPDTHTQDLTPEMRGCPPVCCEDEEQTWQENGQQRCNLETDKVERQFISNCGNLEWREVADINWQDTGGVRCSGLTASDATYTLEKQQTSDCGDLKWVTVGPVAWEDTGTLRCSTTDDTTTDKQQTTQCGDTRWVAGPAQVWTPQGIYRLTSNVEVVEQQQTNQCGRARWAAEAAVWTPTGEYRLTTDPEVVQQKSVNQAGGTKWVNESAVWTATGEYRLTSDVEVVEQKYVNQAGGYKWLPESARWTDTGAVRVSADDPNLIEKQQVNQAGGYKWVISGAQEWTDTGETRCVNHAVQARQLSNMGLYRWFTTGEPCGYLATYPLPDGGLGFDPADTANHDPRATVAIQDCDGNTVAYIYPSAIEGATTAVYAGDCATTGCGTSTNDEADLLGFAVNSTGSSASSCGSCGAGTSVSIIAEPKKVSQYIESCAGQGYLVWSNGDITPVGLPSDSSGGLDSVYISTSPAAFGTAQVGAEIDIAQTFGGTTRELTTPPANLGGAQYEFDGTSLTFTAFTYTGTFTFVFTVDGAQKTVVITAVEA